VSRDGKRFALQPQRTEQSLGAKELEGLAVEGRRFTDAAPAGWHGYDKPIEMSLEVWVSKDIDSIVLWTMTDPRVGKSTWKLTKVDRSEPDADLFLVPPDFKLVFPQ
jgi:hypothetical protein